MTKSNLKKTMLENKEQNKKEFIHKRIDTYSQILKNINYIEQNIDKDDILVKSNTE